MPAEGTKNVADELRERHPGATWLAGQSLHQAQAALRHDWRRVDDATRLNVLQASCAGSCFVQFVSSNCDAHRSGGALSTSGMLEAAPRQAVGVKDTVPLDALRGALLVCLAGVARAEDPAPFVLCGGAPFMAAAQQAELGRPLT